MSQNFIARSAQIKPITNVGYIDSLQHNGSGLPKTLRLLTICGKQ